MRGQQNVKNCCYVLIAIAAMPNSNTCKYFVHLSFLLCKWWWSRKDGNILEEIMMMMMMTTIIIIIREGSKIIFWSSKFPRTRKRISSKCVENFGTRPPKGSPALLYTFLHTLPSNTPAWVLPVMIDHVSHTVVSADSVSESLTCCHYCHVARAAVFRSLSPLESKRQVASPPGP